MSVKIRCNMGVWGELTERHKWGSGSKRSTLDIEGKIAEWRGRNQPSAPPIDPSPPTDPISPPHSRTQLLLDGQEVVCQLVPPPAALIDDLKTRLDAKDEDNESGIHESE